MTIYKITNLLNGKCYIGQTTRVLDERWKEHANRPKKKSAISQAILKYGKDNFSIESLEECDSLEGLNGAEVRWIAKLDTMAPNGYNLATGGHYTYIPVDVRPVGENAVGSVLKESEVLEIIDRIHKGEYLHKIAKDYPQVTKGAISGIHRNITWSHLPRPWDVQPRYNLLEEEAISIIDRLNKGEEVLEIIKDYPEHHPSMIYHIRTSKTWQHLPRNYILAPIPEKHKDEEILEIIKLLKEGNSVPKIHKIYPHIKESYIHQVKNGTIRKELLGERLPYKSASEKLTREQAEDIVIRLANDELITDIWKIYSFIKRPTIEAILKNKIWKSIPRPDQIKYRTPHTLVTEEEAKGIILRLAAGERYHDMVKDYPRASTQTIRDIRGRKSWKNLPWPEEINLADTSFPTKLNEQEVIEIIRRLAEGEKVCEVARDFKHITSGNIAAIQRNETWKHIPRPWLTPANTSLQEHINEEQGWDLTPRDYELLRESGPQDQLSGEVVSTSEYWFE